MAAQLKTHVVKVTGVPDEMLKLIDDKVAKQHFGGRSEYVRELIRRDVLNPGNSKRSPEDIERAVAAAREVFARIEARDTSHVKTLAPDDDVREIIYGERF